MNTDQLRLFLVIAQHRSLSRAAAELDLGQATVSDRLHALEAELGAPLFERHGRGVALTPAGESFRPYAERALEVLREAQDSVRGAQEGERGQVSIAVTVTSGAYLFAPALVAFQHEYPNVEVRVRSAHSWDAPGLILDGVAQLALISGSSLNPQIESAATFNGRLVLVASKHHLLASAPLALEQLAREKFLVSYWGQASQAFLERIRASTPDAPSWRATARAGDDDAPATPETKPGLWMELSPVELVKGMLLAGTGVSLVPEIAVRRELASGELIALQFADPTIRLPVWEINLIRHLRRPPNLAADALAETLIRVLPTLT